MGDTEHLAIAQLGAGDAPAGLRCRRKRTGTRTRPTGCSFSRKGIVFGMRDATAG